MDENKLIKVGGRLKNFKFLDTFKTHQISRSAHRPFTKLLFDNEHKKTLHDDQQIMSAGIRTEYRPFNGRNITVTNNAKIC